MPFFRIPPMDDAGKKTEWGTITGSLSDQTDLRDELDGKPDKVQPSVVNNFVSFADGSGGLKDSGNDAGDFASAQHNHDGNYEVPLTFQQGLVRSGNTISNELITGKQGGQTVLGDTASAGTLTLRSTSNVTKGKIYFGNSVYDEANNKLGISTTSPGAKVNIYNASGEFGSSNSWLKCQYLSYDVFYVYPDSSLNPVIQNPNSGAPHIILFPHSSGNLGIKCTPTNDLSIGGTAARTIGMERNTTSGQSGQNLTLKAGGTKSGETDKDGGSAIVLPGVSTGTGQAKTALNRFSRASSSGTSDNTAQEALIIPSIKNLANDSYVNLFEVSLATHSTCGGNISFTVHASNGTDVVSYSCIVNFAAVRDNSGNFATQIVELSGNLAKANTGSASITGNVWGIDTDSLLNKITIKCKFIVSGITPTSMWLEYTLFNNSRRAVVIL